MEEEEGGLRLHGRRRHDRHHHLNLHLHRLAALDVLLVRLVQCSRMVANYLAILARLGNLASIHELAGSVPQAAFHLAVQLNVSLVQPGSFNQQQDSLGATLPRQVSIRTTALGALPRSPVSPVRFSRALGRQVACLVLREHFRVPEQLHARPVQLANSRVLRGPEPANAAVAVLPLHHPVPRLVLDVLWAILLRLVRLVVDLVQLEHTRATAGA